MNILIVKSPLGLNYLQKELTKNGFKTYQIPEAATITILGGGEIIPDQNTPRQNMMNHVYPPLTF